MKSTVHDGPICDDDYIFLTYTQIMDPNNPGYYESFTCSTIYRKANQFADPATVKVRNYYGKGRFSSPNSGLGDRSTNFRDINFEDLVDDKN